MLGRRHWRLDVEDAVDELLVQLVRLAGVEQRVVNVGRPVVKRREEEAQLRLADDLVGAVAVELVLRRVEPQRRLPSLTGQTQQTM